MAKKRLTVAEAKAQFPDAFQDAIGMPDRRIDDEMARHITHFLEQGESPFDAKLKALCIAKPPDHYKAVSPAGAWPKLVYSESGQTKLAEDEGDYKRLLKDGWSEKPSQAYLSKAQRGTTPREESIRRLQRELDAEVKAKEAETAAA